MSREEMEVVRRLFDLWNSGSPAGWAALHHPDVVVVPPEGWPEGQRLTGLDAWGAQAQRLADSWDDHRLEIDELRPAGSRVLAVFRWVTRGKGSGIEMDRTMSLLATVTAGRIARAEFFMTREDGMRAAGLQ